MTALSQRDARWASIKLGTDSSTVTIVSFMPLIPRIVNKIALYLSMTRLVKMVICKFKIFKSVVFSIPVNVVDNIVSGKYPPDFLAHYKSVFINIAFNVCHRVIPNKNFHISIAISSFATIPPRIILPKVDRRNPPINLSLIRTLSVTEFFVNRWVGVKTFVTKLTSFIYHVQSKYIGLAF